MALNIIHCIMLDDYLVISRFFYTHLGPPELIALLCNPPLSVTHHGCEEAEEEEMGHHTEATVDHMHNGVSVDGVVHRHIDQTHSQLKHSEERDGV